MKRLLIPFTLLAHVTCDIAAVLAFSRITQHKILSSSHALSRRGVARRSYSQRSVVECNNNLSDSSVEEDATTAYYNQLLSMFQGDFDNYYQVVQDRMHELTPGEGGGHEHIHCTLVPCPKYYAENDNDEKNLPCQSHWVLAAFYFNGNPLQIFRFRLYQLMPPPSENLPVRMKLNTLSPLLEKQLRGCAEQPCLWWKEVWNVWCRDDSKILQRYDAAIHAEEWNRFQNLGLPTMALPLEGCDVLWDPNWDPLKHSYLYTNDYCDYPNCGESSAAADASAQPALPAGKSCHATMEAGSAGAIVDSISLIPGKRILIKDELSLWKDEFWINDRGYDPDHEIMDEMHHNQPGNAFDDVDMPFVYGNRMGVPYKLQRVSNFVDGTTNQEPFGLQLKRIIANSDFEWTLGEKYRTPDMLREKMQKLEQYDEAA
ncbi:hypothetical protein ACHAW5_006808 [Stephanodiscus triporus]|uniref:Uncharacterized protein n=1 Tax=Stephanodiscus triporus TaxID=2934178 RepID=A0ABD3N6F5_9STRA